jgi:hypothetical protein
LSATTTVSINLNFGSRRTSWGASKVARFGNEFCKLFQILLVFVVKAILDSTIDIDDGNDLDETQQSASLPSFDFSTFSDTDSRSKSEERQRRKNKKLTFPSCKIGTTISEALAASQAI